MSETNIGGNLPKAHGVQPSFEGKKRANSETPLPKSEATTTQKDINLNQDPAFMGGQSLVKKTKGGEKPYPPYTLEDAKEDAADLKLLLGDRRFYAEIRDIKEKHHLSQDDATLLFVQAMMGAIADTFGSK